HRLFPGLLDLQACSCEVPFAHESLDLAGIKSEYVDVDFGIVLAQERCGPHYSWRFRKHIGRRWHGGETQYWVLDLDVVPAGQKLRVFAEVLAVQYGPGGHPGIAQGVE